MSTGGTVVIGAGPAGLASAAELRRRGVPAVVLERGDGIATSWRGRYDRLRLNTSRWFSRLPGGALRPRHGHLPVARRGRRLPRGLRARQRPRRAPEHARGPHRPPTARAGSCAPRPATSLPSTWSSRPATSTPRTCRTGPAASASAGAAARRRVPQPRALPRPRRARGRPGLLGDGDRLRPRRGRGAEGQARRAHAAEHPRALADGARHRAARSCACARARRPHRELRAAPRRSAT